MNLTPFLAGAVLGIVVAALNFLVIDRRRLKTVDQIWATKKADGTLTDDDLWRFRLRRAAFRFINPILLVVVSSIFLGPALFGDAQ